MIRSLVSHKILALDLVLTFDWERSMAHKRIPFLYSFSFFEWSESKHFLIFLSNKEKF